MTASLLPTRHAAPGMQRVKARTPRKNKRLPDSNIEELAVMLKDAGFTVVNRQGTNTPFLKLVVGECPDRCFLFAHSGIISEIGEADEIFTDATYGIVKKPFHQLQCYVVKYLGAVSKQFLQFL